MSNPEQPFWLEKSLAELSQAEWESLCDGCGKCCLYKIEDIETGKIAYTSVACHLLDLGTCRCRDYPNRQRLVNDCVKLMPESVAEIDWLPSTCAYRLVGEGKDLPPWHPLKSETVDSVHRAGVSVRGWAISEEKVEDIEQHIIQWTP